jgi:hypothetical protein
MYHRIVAHVLCLVAIALATSFTSPLHAGVMAMSATLVGDGFLGQQSFIPDSNPNAHFGLDTLEVFETLEDAAIPILPAVSWVDLVITVERDLTDTGDQMVAVDKFVRNFTTFKWYDFHMTIGTGSGLGFVESDEFDGLFFKDTPSPLNEPGILAPGVAVFKNPPGFDDPNAPDNLWWTVDPAGPGRLMPEQDTSFWLGANLPGNFFDANGMAEFTIRQHATVPEPSTLAIWLIGFAGTAAVRRRRRLKS